MRNTRTVRLAAALLCVGLLVALSRRTRPARAPAGGRHRASVGRVAARGGAAGPTSPPIPQEEIAARPGDGAIALPSPGLPRRPGASLPVPLAPDEVLAAAARQGAALARAAQDVSWRWLELGEGQVRRNLDGLARLSVARSPPELAATHGDLVREGVLHLVEDGRALAEAYARAADIAGRALPGLAGRGAGATSREE